MLLSILLNVPIFIGVVIGNSFCMLTFLSVFILILLPVCLTVTYPSKARVFTNSYPLMFLGIFKFDKLQSKNFVFYKMGTNNTRPVFLVFKMTN